MKERSYESAELELLAALGFGPDTALVREPRILLDRRFLGAMLTELEEQLGDEGAREALLQIGLMYGLRDAFRVVRRDLLGKAAGSAGGLPAATALAIALDAPHDGPAPGRIELAGSWPERYEAEVRLAKLGAAERPSCALSAGYTAGWLSGLFDADVLVVETECCAQGATACRFEAREVHAWREAQDPRALPLLRSVRFDHLREATTRSLASEMPEADAEGPFDPDAPVVHVWGPVMVLPFLGPDEALQAVEMLSRDPGICGVRAVVVDLRGLILDEGYGAAALEQLLRTVSSWSAEAILTNVCALSEPVVADLEHAHLLVRKDLPEAIAAAFQIADVQRHPL